jgi:hypothetical protein
VLPRDSEPGMLVTLRRFRDAPEALLAKSILDSAEIECILGDENLVRVDWFWSNLIGGIKLWVRREDAAAAAALLYQGIPEGFEVEGVGKYKQPRCPNCQSFDVSFKEQCGCKCNACGHEWQEAGDTAA